MTPHLLPCPECNRHVRVVEAVCPFCGHELPMAYRSSPAPRLPRTRLGRAATFAFGAAVATSVAAGCSSRESPRGGTDAGAVTDGGGGTTDGGGTDGGGSDAGSTTDAGGATDAGSSTDGGTTTDAGVDAGTPTDDGGVAPLYGGPTPVDAGSASTGDAGGFTPLYGAPPPA